VTLVTSATGASSWTVHTLEQRRIQRRLLEAGVEILASHALTAASADAAQVACLYTGRTRELSCDALVLVTGRLPQDALCSALAPHVGERVRSVRAVGDAYCPGTIAAAVWDGHRYAEELDAPPAGGVGFRRELDLQASTY
jgi:dimethylamine/trimethylamine dehydrogenase